MSYNRRTRTRSRPRTRARARSQPRQGNYTLLRNNIYTLGRNATEANVPFFESKVQEGKLKGPNAKAELVLPAQSLGRNNQMVGYTKAMRIRPQWVTQRDNIANPVALQQRDSMEQGTICMIDKNGACVPIGFTDPQYTTRTTESMRREYQEIMNDPATTLPDIQRARQLLRMIHTREASEYLERERLRRERDQLRRERSTRTRLYNLLRNGARSFRGLFSRRRANEGGTRRNRP